MNLAEWLLFAGACAVVQEYHEANCQCRTCRAASVVAAFGLHRIGLLKGIASRRSGGESARS